MAVKCYSLLLWFVSLVCVGQACEAGKVHVQESAIQRLFDLVLEGQEKIDHPIVTDKMSFKTKGNYQNVQMMQHIGDRSEKWITGKMGVTPFLTMSVSLAIMEAHIYGRAPRPTDEQLLSTLELCNSFLDATKPFNNSIILYMPCNYDEIHKICVPMISGSLDLIKLDNSTTVHHLDNKQIRDLSEMGKAVTFLDKKLHSLNLSDNLNEQMSLFAPLLPNPQDALNWVSDTDVTFTWLTLGSMFIMLGEKFPLVRDTWIKFNPNISSIFDALKKYAYRPFSDNPLVNTVDPPAYYVLRNFLDDAKATGKDVALASVWFTNAEDKPYVDKGTVLHKEILDIDAAVLSDTIHSITVLVLSDLVGTDILEDKDVSQIYQNSSTLISYLINSNFTNRPDLALPFQVSLHYFYWTIARTVSIMDSYKRKQELPAEAMEDVYRDLKHALEGDATRFFLENAKRNDDDSIYFDDFLGNEGVTEDNEPIIRGEDRIYTTAISANALMYTWLSFDSESSKSYWKTGTPESVKDIVDGCILWLVKNTFEGHFKPWNAMVITQSKGNSTLSFRYPANHFVELPQIYSLQHATNLRLIVGMRGYVPKNEYEAMIKASQFGKPVPEVFKGYNHPDFGDKVFWSSDSFTYAVTLLAMSRYREISGGLHNDCVFPS